MVRNQSPEEHVRNLDRHLFAMHFDRSSQRQYAFAVPFLLRRFIGSAHDVVVSSIDDSFAFTEMELNAFFRPNDFANLAGGLETFRGVEL